MVKTLPANARDTGSVPGLGFHMPDCESLCNTTTEPVLESPETATAEPTHCKYRSPGALKLMLPNRRSHRSEKPKQRNWRAAPTLHNWRRAQAATESPHSQIDK